MKTTTSKILKVTAEYHEAKLRPNLEQAVSQVQLLQKTGASGTILSYAHHCAGQAKQDYSDNLVSENRARAKHLWI